VIRTLSKWALSNWTPSKWARPRHRTLPRRPRGRSSFAALAVATAAALLLGGCQFGGLASLPLPGAPAQGSDVYHVTVQFADVLDLVPQSAVKVNDVTVGAVESISLSGWHADVHMRIENSVHLPGNAVADIKQTSLLGEKYIALSAPTNAPASGALHDGSMIPLSRTGANPQIEEVLSALSALLNGGGVAQLHTITVELNKALSGREQNLRDFLTQLDTFVTGLNKQRDDIIRALDGIDKLSKTLNDQHTVITTAVDQVPGALKTLADDRTMLTKLLTSLANLGNVGTRVINESKASLLTDLRDLDPVLTELNQAGTDLPNALDLLLTYPLPQGLTSAVKGDYVNLKVTADLNLNDLYHNLLGGLLPNGSKSPTPKPGQSNTPAPILPLPSLPLPLPSVLLPLPSCLLLCGGGHASATPHPGASPSASGGILCPILCLGGAQNSATQVDPNLAALMTEGMAT
jgi:phospholipid/cholesterol/gamma-HCH transport system substrate-binding protein